MKQSTSHLLSIINNVLDMAKIDAGEMKLSIQGFNLEEEIQTALAPLRSLAVENNIHLALTMQDDMPRFVEGDPDRLRQIILNLGGNALKFTKEGEVHITIQCWEASENQYMFQLVVEDTGQGMTQETLEKLFLPFYQADDGSVPQSKGTGLGMTITQELVELMGGQIHAESLYGQGTKVEVSVMFKKTRDSHHTNSDKSSGPTVITEPSTKDPKILVVEDNEFNQIILRRILEKKGLSCDLVGDGQQAVEKATNHHYDLVLMDIQLPLMDGLEATRQIRNRVNMHQPKIIVVTAYADWEDQKACKAAGMDGFLAKPITFESIAKVLESECEF